MGGIGFLDDYIKKFKNDKEGLKGKFKVLRSSWFRSYHWLALYFHPEVTMKREIPLELRQEISVSNSLNSRFYPEVKSTQTTIPFLKNNEFDYSDLITWISPDLEPYTWMVFIFVVIFIITAVSNGANLTDGIDGLAAGSSAHYSYGFRNFCLGIGKYHFCRLFRYYVYP